MPKINKVPYTLNPCRNEIPEKEIKIIIRAADDIVYSGGRSLLAKILKGSKDKKVIELELDKSPVYGAFKDESIEAITAKIDWMIGQHYLRIEYEGKLPLLGYQKKGYDIAVELRSDEYFEGIGKAVKSKNFEFARNLKDKNREMIFLLLEKINQNADKEYIPFLEFWKTIDYKKVSAKIEWVIKELNRK